MDTGRRLSTEYVTKLTKKESLDKQWEQFLSYLPKVN